MTDTININPKPKKTITFFDGQIELDKVYSFELVKTTNGTKSYSVQEVTYEITDGEEKDPACYPIIYVKENDPRYSLIVGAIINWAEKNGVGN